MIRYDHALPKGKKIYQLWGSTSNAYAIVDPFSNATYLVDCGMPSDTTPMLKILADLPPLQRVICTHFHVDHISGWIQLQAAFPATTLWFHEQARSLVSGKQTVPFPGLRAIKEILIPCLKEYAYKPILLDASRGALYGTPFKKGFPGAHVRFFSEDTQVLPGFTNLHTPGHRPDEISFWEPDSGIFISGDFIVVLNGKPLLNSFVASPSDQLASFVKVQQLGIKGTLCPGHGQCQPFSIKSLHASSAIPN